MTDAPKPPHPDRLPPGKRRVVDRKLAHMVQLGRFAGDPFLDAFSRSSTVALAANDPERGK